MNIYESEHCIVDVTTPRSKRVWFIGDSYDSYESPNWSSREEMIADLEAAVAALRAVDDSFGATRL